MPTSQSSLSEFLRVLLKSLALQNAGVDSSGKPSSGRVVLREEPKELHTAFYRIKRKYEKHFPILGEMHFIEAGAYPYSSELTDALDRLQMAGAITRENPSYQKFSPTLMGDTFATIQARRGQLVGSSPARRNAFDELLGELDQVLVVK